MIEVLRQRRVGLEEDNPVEPIRALYSSSPEVSIVPGYNEITP